MPLPAPPDQVGGARRVVHEQHLLPGLAAVPGAEHAALGVGAPHMAQHGHEYDVGVGGIDDDPRDLSHVTQPHELPALARVGRHEHAATVHYVIARVPFPGAHPDDVRVRRCERDGADRRRRLVLEDRFPRIAPVDRLPYAARRRTDVVQVAVSRHADHGGHTTTGHRGAEVSELEVVERIRTADRGHLRRLLLFHPAPTLRRSRRGEHERQEQTADTGLTESHAAHRTSSSGGSSRDTKTRQRALGRCGLIYRRAQRASSV